MRAVIYARYSSDNQRDASIEDQLRLCREFIDRQGWDELRSYTDRAISGATPLRPAYQQLLEDARSRQFDIVVAEALDRLSRDQEDVAALYKHLIFAGIQLVTLAEGEINELHVGLKGTMNALFLKDLAQKTWRGLEGRARQGKSAGGKSYGYDVVRHTDMDGNPIRGDRLINVAEAPIVRRIFDAFASGKSPRRIAHELNAEQIPGPMGRPWRDTAIRGHGCRGTGILNNELYVGRLVWNRLHYVKDPASGKRVSRLNSPEAWIVQEVPELRIIDDDLWNKVKERQRAITDSPRVTKARSTEFWKRRRAKHLLTGKVQCGECGAAFASVGRDYLACSAARGQGTCTNRRGIRREGLDDLILDALKDNLMHPDLVKEFIAAFHEEVNRAAGLRDTEMTIKRKELAGVTRRLDGLIDAIADGLRTPGLKSKLEDLEQRKVALDAELARIPSPVLRLHPNLAEV
jgi:DNA invertase Pin-like site-specific DNA recombinase